MLNKYKKKNTYIGCHSKTMLNMLKLLNNFKKMCLYLGGFSESVSICSKWAHFIEGNNNKNNNNNNDNYTNLLL